MVKILLQAGHAAWTSRSGYSYPDGGGAPGEAQWAWDLAHLMAARLAASDVESLIMGQWYGYELPEPPEAADPADLFIALHYDAAVYSPPTGCFADRWANETETDATDSFIRIWSDSYPLATGISLHNERRNARTRLYYAYSAVKIAPAVLLEHGCGSPVPVGIYPPGGDSKYLHDHIDVVASVNVAAILSYLIEHGLLPAEEAEDMAKIAELESKVTELVSTNSALSDQVGALREEIGKRNADVTRLTDALATAERRTRPRYVEVTTEDDIVHPFVREVPV